MLPQGFIALPQTSEHDTNNVILLTWRIQCLKEVSLFIVSSLTKSSNDPRELYLGLLYPTEDYKVYPFLIKIIFQRCTSICMYTKYFNDLQPSMTKYQVN